MYKPFVPLPLLLAVVIGHVTSPELNRNERLFRDIFPRHVPIHHTTLKAPRVEPTAFSVTVNPELIRFGAMRPGERKVIHAKLINFSADPVDVREVRLREGRGFKLLSPVGRFILGPAGNAGATLDVEIECTAAEPGIVTDAVELDEGKGFGSVAQVEAMVSE